MLSKEIKQKLKKYTEQLIWEEKEKKKLLNQHIDYNFLQTLIDRTNANPDLQITIFFKSGDKMVLKQQYKEEPKEIGFDGLPAFEELK